MKTTLIGGAAAILMALAPSAGMANIMTFSQASPGLETIAWGFEKAETYNVAILIDDSSFIGCKVKQIRVPLNNGAGQDFKGWISSQLKTEIVNDAKQNITDVEYEGKVEGEGDDTMLVVDFTDPYEITGPFYAGYSLTIPKIDLDDKTDPRRFPIAVKAEKNEKGFFLFTSRTNRSWSNFTEYTKGLFATSAMEVLIEGTFEENSAGFGVLNSLYAKAGENFTCPVTLINHSATEIKDIDFTYTADGVTRSGHYVLETPLPGSFNSKISFSLPMEPFDNIGSFDFALTLDKLNGVDNNDPQPTQNTTLNVVELVPVNRPLMEEFTGLWCGYCPRGWAGMENMNHRHGDDFVGVAYHNGDLMQPSCGVPSLTSNYPKAFLNRTISCDPYAGTSGTAMGIELDWLEQRAQNAVAAIEVYPYWDPNDPEKLMTPCQVYWAGMPDDTDPSNYRLMLLLTEDKLSDPSWGQYNNFVNDSFYTDDPTMDPFTKGASVVYGIEYSDVVIDATDFTGVPGSIKKIMPFESTTFSYSFRPADAKAALGSKKPLMQNKENLKVVAALVHHPSNMMSKYGVIINSVKRPVGEMPASVKDVQEGAVMEAVLWYDLQGRAVKNPDKGIYLKVVKFSDGSSRSYKVAL